MNRREQLAKDNGMTIEFVNWFFDNKKDGCGNAWLVMMAAMWESWKHLSEQRDALAAECASTQAYLRNGPVINKGGELLAAHQFAPATPATDAFLREVRAQGIDAASAELNQLAERSEKEAPIAAEHHRSAALYLQLLAAKLRQGGAA